MENSRKLNICFQGPGKLYIFLILLEFSAEIFREIWNFSFPYIPGILHAEISRKSGIFLFLVLREFYMQRFPGNLEFLFSASASLLYIQENSCSFLNSDLYDGKNETLKATHAHAKQQSQSHEKWYKRSVLRRQCSDTNQNIKRLVYCRYNVRLHILYRKYTNFYIFRFEWHKITYTLNIS